MPQSEDPERVASDCCHALALNPNDIASLYLLGVARVQQGRLAAARLLFERGLAQQPDQPDILVALGNLLNQSAQGDLALDHYKHALDVQPGHAGALINMGALWHARGQYGKALAAYDQVLANPEQLSCLVNRALSLHELGRFAEAVVTLNYAHVLAPSDCDVLMKRANASLAALDYPSAEADYRQVMARRPSDLDACVGLANTLAAAGDGAKALKLLDEVLQAEPSHIIANFNRANILREQKHFAKAIDAYDDVLGKEPDFARAQWNKGLCLLLGGNFREGLALYEWRKRLPVPVEGREYDAPLWTGSENLAGRTLFLYIEQGLGDALQLFRFIKPLQGMGARIVLSCQDQLRGIFASAGTQAEIVSSDYVQRGSTITALFPVSRWRVKLREETIPAAIPYLYADRERVAKWNRRIGVSGFRIGIAWETTDNVRSYPLALLADFGRLTGVRLISIQKGAGAEQLRALPPGMAVERLEPFDEGPQAFLDTAAIMTSLDLIITPDTSIAHLAGALARPGCVMLKEVPDWRWMMDRQDSPWYPTLKLFRQPGPGDWEGAFAALKQDVLARITQK